MLIYIEKKIRNHPISHQIVNKLPSSQILEIDHYKNIFDKLQTIENTPALIIAKDETPKLYPVPEQYGYPGKAFFFRTSLNCLFDCEYCYLKGGFKSNYPVFFVNYEEIQSTIRKTIQEERQHGYT